MKKHVLYLLAGGIVLLAACRNNTPWLANLQAGKEFPLYTIYAAAQERSEFILDQGYTFRYENDDLGADFITDTGGDIGLTFKMGEKTVYKTGEMHKPPVITASYPDMVRYGFEPFGGIKVEATFFTYSSRSAWLDISVTNNTSGEALIEVFPFMRSNLRGYHSFETGSEYRMITFSHEEYPDEWTLSHQLPYADSIRNLLLIKGNSDQAYSFTSEKGESPMVHPAILLGAKPVRQLNGRIYSPAGERIPGTAPVNRLQLIVNNDYRRMVTENSPVWGSSQPVFEASGYFRIEGGNINPDAKTFRLTGYNEVSGLQATAPGNFTSASARTDIHLKDTAFPVITQISLENGQLHWEHPTGAESFAVYRRVYPDHIYSLLAKDVTGTVFHDTDIPEGKTCGYVVACIAGGTMGMHSREVVNIEGESFNNYVMTGEKRNSPVENIRILGFKNSLVLKPGKTEKLRLLRSTLKKTENRDSMYQVAASLLEIDVKPYIKHNNDMLNKVRHIGFSDPRQEALYWSCVNMMRQQFYPPEAKSDYNYYVFSREPTWGWGHGGQVFHESIVMLAYANIDPVGAINSQRVYRQRQYPNGYINYRTGSWLDEIIEYNGELTSSAPWYSWLNHEVYLMTRDRQFLEEMYASSVKFYEFYVSNRDKDNDGLCEWGGHAVLESIRDALVAVWDQVAWPANFEALDLNCMLVMEAKSLEAMARELGRNIEAEKWKADHEKRAELINQYCWDAKTGFYYNINKDDHSFTYKEKDDLKRMEIIGFLPLWAGIACQGRANAIIGHLLDPAKFWRKYGIPSLAADDIYYNDKGYWNGPVWVQWNYLILRGLLNYGYEKEAKELVDKVTSVMYDRLEKDHNLWEFYSPDDLWGGHHKTYIWAGIINRMMEDVQNINQPQR